MKIVTFSYGLFSGGNQLNVDIQCNRGEKFAYQALTACLLACLYIHMFVIFCRVCEIYFQVYD